MSDRIFALVWLCVCALMIVQMWGLEIPFSYEPVGPKPFPVVLALLMAACSVYLLIKPDLDITWPHGDALLKGAALIATLLLYAYFFEWLGFPLATTLMGTTVSMLFGGSWLRGVITGVLLGVVGFLFFDRLLQVTLPMGFFLR